MLHRAHDLKGFKLGALDGELGHVRDFYFDDQNWHVRYIIADTGQWLPGRKVLLAPHAFGGVDEDERIVHVQLTMEQVEKSPSVEAEQPVSRQFEEEYLRHFGWPFYWVDPNLWGAPPTVPRNGIGEGAPVQKGDPHLRSYSEIVGYHLQAQDGEIGHVDDMILDDSTWAIRDIVIDTRNWIAGKRVLIPPQWIENVSWEDAKIFVKARRKQIEDAPDYDPSRTDVAEYERAVAQSYGRMPPWP